MLATPRQMLLVGFAPMVFTPFYSLLFVGVVYSFVALKSLALGLWLLFFLV